MRKSRYKKIIILGILLIFIGASIVPNISGNVGETIKRSNQDIVTNFLLNNDYVNVYWQFDDCSGDTLTDSIHSYDGAINGATWTTSGHSGCALIFDGVNDYVLLNAYSNELGLNKTDDSIYSFWFKSTTGGIIFSATASWGYNPELRIELCPNGTLMFKAWTQLCGIALFSSDTYNDGEWHHAEFYFNGITSNPTIDLVVDSVWDNSVTHWLCEIASDEFAKTRIGMHAYYSTDHFDGYIDDFKIIKFEQGNDQAAPSIDGPTEGNPNIEYEYTFVTNDPEEDEIFIQIDWDDGTDIEWVGPFDSGEEVTIDHKWVEEGFYEIRAKSKDRWDDSSWSPKYEVKIGNQPPEIPDVSGPKFGDIDVEYTFSFISYDTDENDIYYYIDWGDGTNEDWFGPFASGLEITASHTWTSEAIYSVKAKAKDEFGFESDYSEPHLIYIGNHAPEKPEISGKTKGKPEVEYDYKIYSIDADGDNISKFVIDWGDDTGDVVINGPFESGEEITASHAWASEGTYTIRVKAEDTWGAEGEWGIFKVTMPRNKVLVNSLFIQLLESIFDKLPNIFPILKNLINN
ncbi:hypothetical protein AYK24_07860 [Thermoplasmatales archaeon SG8-52-4]|nr:MAG: hypothetical protein AYK24_07860 [Thermoplasmatales archaeon SG8-52-4]